MHLLLRLWKHNHFLFAHIMSEPNATIVDKVFSWILSLNELYKTRRLFFEVS